MQPADKKRFAELMMGLAHTYNSTLIATNLKNYWCLLRNYPLAEVERAVKYYCSSPEGHRFMPKPGELIALIAGNPAHQAAQAWTKVIRAVRQIGRYATVVFDDTLIHSVIYDMGGWKRLCDSPERDVSFKEREFEKRYVHYLQRPPQKYPKQLTGEIDVIHTAQGKMIYKTPILIGDTQQAYHVFKRGQEVTELLSFQPLSQRIEMEEVKKIAEKESGL